MIAHRTLTLLSHPCGREKTNLTTTDGETKNRIIFRLCQYVTMPTKIQYTEMSRIVIAAKFSAQV